MITRTSTGHHQQPNRGRTDEWYTPPFIFAALGLTFDLDPCSPEDGPVPWIPARRFLTIADHGLLAPWDGRVWLNSPFGPDTDAWLGRLAAHGDGVALTFARTDTRWFHEYAVLADALCFLRGRPHFFRQDMERAPFNSGGPIVLLGYGAECGSAVMRCGESIGASCSFRKAVALPGMEAS